MGKEELIGLSERQMGDLLAAWGERPYRARQLFHALYHERRWDMCTITTFPERLRKRLDQEFQATLPQVEKKFQSSDGTSRYLLRLADGREIETVLMPEEGRDTICVSTQAGCPAARSAVTKPATGCGWLEQPTSGSWKSMNQPSVIISRGLVHAPASGTSRRVMIRWRAMWPKTVFRSPVSCTSVKT